VLAVGGDHLSNDLAIGLKVPLGRAEQLKLDYGSAVVQPGVKGQVIHLTNDFGLPLRSINLENLQRILWLRTEETLELVRQEVEAAGLLDYLRAGVYLCGGCARLPHITELAEQVFGLPAFLGRTQGVSGLKSALDQPEFATAIGLVLFGASRLAHTRQKPSFMTGLAESFRQLLGRR